MDTKINIVICDDDKSFANELHHQILNIISEHGYDCDIHEFFNGDESVRYCERNLADIVLVDIDMPKMNGFDTVKELQKNQPDLAVIFVTSHEEYAYQAYDYQPFWFVSKRKIEKLNEVMSKLLMKIKHRKESREIIHLNFGSIVDINVNEVVYLKSDRHYISVFNNDEEITKFRGGIKEVYEQLKYAGYIYVHRSYIVNCRFIDRFDYQCVTLKSGKKISVTRNKEIINEAKKIYAKFMRESRW